MSISPKARRAPLEHIVSVSLPSSWFQHKQKSHGS